MTGRSDEIDWRIYFQNREYHSILSRAVLDLLLLIVFTSRKGGLISERKHQTYKQRLEQARNSDLSQIYKLIYMDCETQVLVRGHYNCKLIWLLRALEAHDSDYVEQNRDKIIFLSWRLRETEILCKFLKEARNAQAHDTNSRQHLGWLISIPSNILRLIEICPPNQLMKDSVLELERICKGHITETLLPENETSAQKIAEPIALPSQELLTVSNSSIDAIESKLDTILECINAQERNTISTIDIVTADAEEEDPAYVETRIEIKKYNKIEYLTPKMVRDQLLRLSHKADKSMVDDMVLSPNEKLLQIAIIEEIVSHKVEKIQDIFELPDVNWRYKRYKNFMEQQLEKLGKEIQNILDRAVWE